MVSKCIRIAFTDILNLKFFSGEIAKSQLNDIIVLPDFSFSNLLLSNELPYNFHFLCKFSGVSELLAETSKYGDVRPLIHTSSVNFRQH